MNSPAIRTNAFFSYGFLILWILLNAWSAFYTGLAHDEAYYWMYSKNLDWGYFDHPPAVAILIKAGYLLFQNEFGVRILNVLLFGVSLGLMWQLCRKYKEDLLLFVSLIGGIIIFHVYGFIIVPDSLLLVATILYFWVLKKYLSSDNLQNILFLTLAVTFMLYSKYHGFLILLFTLAASPRLLKRKSFWAIAVITFFMLLPHILWQVRNDYPSLQYHLVDRVNSPYMVSHSMNYILEFFFITGPLLSFILLYALFKVNIKDEWERVLKVTVLGFIIFFFLASFRGKIEANWNSPMVIPLFILGFKYLSGRVKLRQWTVALGVITFGLTLFLRTYLVSDILYKEIAHVIPIKDEFHHWDTWAAQIAEEAGERPVMFFDSYQKASKYEFYSGKPALSYNTINFRKNQYDIWDIESKIQGKDVLLVYRNDGSQLTGVNTIFGETYLYKMRNFRSFRKIIVLNLHEPLVLQADSLHKLDAKFKNTFAYPVNLYGNTDVDSEIMVMIFKNRELIIQDSNCPVKKKLEPGETFKQNVSFRTPEEKGVYDFILSVKNEFLPPERNYKSVKLIVQ